MIEYKTKKIDGNWHQGIALDTHTTASTYLGKDASGKDRFETHYTPVGQLLYNLKYRSDQTAAADLIMVASNFLERHKSKFDIIVPVPPSQERVIQPVILLANGIGKNLNIPVVDCIKTTRDPRPLKSIDNPEERREALKGLYTVNPIYTQQKRVLLFDDLFRSGSTMNAITNILMDLGQVELIYALTITCTRSNK